MHRQRHMLHHLPRAACSGIRHAQFPCARRRLVERHRRAGAVYVAKVRGWTLVAVALGAAIWMSAVGINGRNRQQLRVAHQIKIGPAISWQSASWAFAIVPRGKQVNDTFAVAAMIGAITGRRAHHGILIYAADSAIDLSAPAII